MDQFAIKQPHNLFVLDLIKSLYQVNIIDLHFMDFLLHGNKMGFMELEQNSLQ